MSAEANKGVFGMILTYNCAAFLEHTVRIIPKELFEKIIIIDDGSTDDTAEVAARLGVPLYSHAHGGYGSNIKFGLKKCAELGAEIIVEIHGDGQFTSSIPAALEYMRKGCDLVLGNRFYDLRQPRRDGMSFIRYWGNSVLSGLGGIVFGIRPQDLFTGFRVYSRRLALCSDFAHSSDDYFFSFEIIALARYANMRICHVPARSFYNQAHTSISLRKGCLEIAQTPFVLCLYLLAQMGVRLGIFAAKIRRY
jgi:glycosyltransferase involved in cell wall biosynthesis